MRRGEIYAPDFRFQRFRLARRVDKSQKTCILRSITHYFRGVETPVKKK
jgi:hypothetical protein